MAQPYGVRYSDPVRSRAGLLLSIGRHNSFKTFLISGSDRCMYITSDTLDDGLIELYPKLLESKSVVQTTRGETTELLGVQIEIQKPRARLSRTETRGKPFSALGELLWYLSRDNQLEFIERYVPRYRDDSEDGLTIYGGYGPRLFGHHGQNQIQNVINLLKSKSTTRRAVIQLFDAEDIGSVHKEIPCTTTLQFFVRHDQVQLMNSLASLSILPDGVASTSTNVIDFLCRRRWPIS
jgi:thymidylate synthase